MTKRRSGKLVWGLVVPLALVPWSGTARAAGDAAAGARKAVYCAYCHGLDGNPIDPGVPRLAGQPARRLLARIKALESDGDIHAAMLKALLTGNIGERELVDLAAYYAAQQARTASGAGH